METNWEFVLAVSKKTRALEPKVKDFMGGGEVLEVAGQYWRVAGQY